MTYAYFATTGFTATSRSRTILATPSTTSWTSSPSAPCDWPLRLHACAVQCNTLPYPSKCARLSSRHRECTPAAPSHCQSHVTRPIHTDAGGMDGTGRDGTGRDGTGVVGAGWAHRIQRRRRGYTRPEENDRRVLLPVRRHARTHAHASAHTFVRACTRSARAP